MNEPNDSTPPPILPRPHHQSPHHSKSFLDWTRYLFACNPFYLASAALLLFGCYRVSIDATFFTREATQLIFNFSSLQFYEVLLVFTAIFLARRNIWYDSTLLVGLENLLLFVPFIFISQAALIDSHKVQLMCAAGALMAVVRFGCLKGFFGTLNLPYRVLGLGSVLLVLNVALPLIYRNFGQTRIVHIDSGPLFEMNEYTWLLILPAVFALVNFLPHARETGNLLPQHRWLPSGAFFLWLIATSVHLYCLDYIYQFDLRGELLAPTLWVLAWTACRRLSNETRLHGFRDALFFAPALVPLFAFSNGGGKTFLILTALNISIYGTLCILKRDYRLLQHLLFASIVLLISGLPETWVLHFTPEISRGKYVAGSVITYLLFWTVLLRDPRLAMFGAIALGTSVMIVFGKYNGAIHWAMQAGFGFLLLHSLRWEDSKHQGADVLRWLSGFFWTLQSFVWIYYDGGKAWMPCIVGAIVVGIYAIVQIMRGNWTQFFIPVTATIVILSGPSHLLAQGVHSLPIGPLAVITSFVFLACGTIGALTKHRWHRGK